jgi:SOS-response transcriptional repressor LexA
LQANALLAERQLLLRQLDEMQQQFAEAQHRLAVLRLAALQRQEAVERLSLAHRDLMLLQAEAVERYPARPVN